MSTNISTEMDDIMRDLKNRRKANDIYIAIDKTNIEKANANIVMMERENREMTSQIRQIAIQGKIQ